MSSLSQWWVSSIDSTVPAIFTALQHRFSMQRAPPGLSFSLFRLFPFLGNISGIVAFASGEVLLSQGTYCHSVSETYVHVTLQFRQPVDMLYPVQGYHQEFQSGYAPAYVNQPQKHNWPGVTSSLCSTFPVSLTSWMTSCILVAYYLRLCNK